MAKPKSNETQNPCAFELNYNELGKLRETAIFSFPSWTPRVRVPSPAPKLLEDCLYKIKIPGYCPGFLFFQHGIFYLFH